MFLDYTKDLKKQHPAPVRAAGAARLDPIALAVIIFIKIREKRAPITTEGYSIRIFLLLLKTL